MRLYKNELTNKAVDVKGRCFKIQDKLFLDLGFSLRPHLISLFSKNGVKLNVKTPDGNLLCHFSGGHSLVLTEFKGKSGIYLENNGAETEVYIAIISL